MKGEFLITEAVHLFDLKDPEDLLGCQVPSATGRGILEAADQILMNQLGDTGKRAEDLVDLAQFGGVLVLHCGLDNRGLVEYDSSDVFGGIDLEGNCIVEIRNRLRRPQPLTPSSRKSNDFVKLLLG
jgi:hypothetical protein